MLNVATFLKTAVSLSIKQAKNYLVLTLVGFLAHAGAADAFTELIELTFERNKLPVQFGTQVKFRWSRDHNNRTAENAFPRPDIFLRWNSNL